MADITDGAQFACGKCTFVGGPGPCQMCGYVAPLPTGPASKSTSRNVQLPTGPANTTTRRNEVLPWDPREPASPTTSLNDTWQCTVHVSQHEHRPLRDVFE